MMNIEKGDFVKCIDDKPIVEPFERWVIKDEVYRVRQPITRRGEVFGLLLEEIHNDLIHNHRLEKMEEPSFYIDRFVKINPQTLMKQQTLF